MKPDKVTEASSATSRHTPRNPASRIPSRDTNLAAGAAMACILLLSACATDKPAPPAPAKRPVAARPNPSPAPVHAPSVPAPPEPASGTSPPSATPLRPESPAATAAAEWQQLARYQKSPFQVFTLTETQAGLQPMPGSVGIYSLPAPQPGAMRLRLALRPDSPVRLGAGAYSVQLQLVFEYIERRSCKAPSCHGEVEEASRKAAKSVRLLLTPQHGYVAETTLPLPLARPGQPDRDYDVGYADLVLKVRRVTIAPARNSRLALP